MSEKLLHVIRAGCFTISEAEIHNKSETVADLMAKMRVVIVRAEHLFATREIEYIGISPLFRPIGLGEKVPVYRIFFESSNGEVVAVKAEEQEK